jgi:hypothetical protein
MGLIFYMWWYSVLLAQMLWCGALFMVAVAAYGVFMSCPVGVMCDVCEWR